MKKTHKLFEDFRELLLAYWGLKFGILQHLDNSSESVSALSERSGIPVQRLMRLLRGLCWRNILEPADDEKIIITELGKHYLEESEKIMFQGSFFLRQWTFLDSYFESGQDDFFKSKCGLNFELINSDQGIGEVFAAPWADRTSEYTEGVAGHPAFVNARTVVDIGGAEGKLIGDLLSVHRHLIGIVFDLPYCRKAFDKQNFNLSNRISFEEGSFFEKIPENRDIYILKWILHDWNDENAVKILHKCANAMNSDSVLLIVERIVPENLKESVLYAKADLDMLALNSGKERTEKEFERLLEQSGLNNSGKFDFANNYGFSIIEGKRI